MNATYYIFETIGDEQYNVGQARSEEEAKKEIDRLVADDAKYGRDTKGCYDYSTNRYN